MRPHQLLCLLALTLLGNAFAQDQTINGKLTVNGNTEINSTTPGAPRSLIIKGNENANSASAGNIEFFNTTNSFKLAKISAGTATQTNDGVLKFFTKTSWNTDYVEQMRIDEFGRVGINGVPTQTLHIHQVYPVLLLDETDASANEKKWFIEANSGVFRLRALNDAENAGTDFLRVTRSGHTVGTVAFTTGNVGIGTHVVGYGAKLHVNGIVSADHRIESRAGGSATPGNGAELCLGNSVGNYAMMKLSEARNGYSDLDFYTRAGGGWERTMTLTGANQRVGIGTSSPGAILHIQRDANTSGAPANAQLHITGNTSATKRLSIAFNTSSNYGELSAETGAGQYVPIVINPNGGNVGIGTTTPGSKLAISFNGCPTGVVDAIGDFSGKVVAIQADGDPINAKTGYWARFTNSPGIASGMTLGREGAGWGTYVAFHTHPDSAATMDNSPERMRIDPDGNVGIGETNPQAKLHVKALATDPTGTYIAQFSGDAVSGGFKKFGNNVEVLAYRATVDELRIGPAYANTNPPAKGAIIEGNVGIGTSDPKRKLHLSNAGSSEFVITDSSAGAGLKHWRMQSHGGELSFDTIADDFNTAADRFAINSAGNVYMGQSSGNGAFDLTLGNDAVAANINGAGDLLTLNVDSNSNSAGTPNIQLKVKGTLEMMVDANRVYLPSNDLEMVNPGGNGLGLGLLSHYSETYSGLIFKKEGTRHAGMRWDGAKLEFHDASVSGHDPDNWTSTQMVWDVANGRFGIGAAPSYKLHITGTQNQNRIVSSNSTSGTYIMMHANDTEMYLTGSGYGKTLHISNQGDAQNHGDILFSTNGAQAMRIIGNGNIGIGTNGPSYKLHVAGAGVQRMLVESTDNHAAGAGVHFAVKNAGVTTGLGTVRTDNQGNMSFFTGSTVEAEHMRIAATGNVGIGIAPDATHKLTVDGKIRAEEIIVEVIEPADYVFEKDYKLRSLEEVEAHVTKHKHLPGIPSGNEIKKNGLSMGQMMNKQLEKIEELTLYAIQQQKQLDAGSRFKAEALKELEQKDREIAKVAKKNQELERRLERLEKFLQERR